MIEVVFFTWLSLHLCLAVACSVWSFFFSTIVRGQTGFANSPYTLSGLSHPPLSAHFSLPLSVPQSHSFYYIYVFYTHYLCLSLSFLFSVTFHLPVPVIILPTCLDWRDDLCFQHVWYLFVAVPVWHQLCESACKHMRMLACAHICLRHKYYRVKVHYFSLKKNSACVKADSAGLKIFGS